MKFLGIDYGTKKIGLALSDVDGKIAFPHSVVTTHKRNDIERLIEEEGVGEIIIGESLTKDGKENKVQEAIRDYAGYLGLRYGIPVHFEKEFFTSSEARWSKKRKKPVANPRRRGSKEEAPIDDSAAALILQRYLDKIQLK